MMFLKDLDLTAVLGRFSGASDKRHVNDTATQRKGIL